MKKSFLIIVFLLSVFSISFANCGCGDLSIKESFKSSDAIFRGKLIKKELLITEINAQKIETKQKYTRMVYTFLVNEVIKGKIQQKKIQITTKYNDINFILDTDYLVYSYYSEYLLTSNFYLNGERVEPFLVTDNCTNSKKICAVDKKELKKIRKLARRMRK